MAEIILRYLSPESKALFPLQRISDLEKLFQIECKKEGEEPNLAVLSIILGAVENSLVQLDYSKAAPISTSNKGRAKKASVGGKRKKGRGSSVASVEFKEAIITSSEGPEGSNNVSMDASSSSSTSTIQENGMMMGDSDNKENNVKGDFPPLDFDVVEALFLKFYHEVVKQYINLKDYGMEEGFEVEITPKVLVQRVSGAVWSGLARSYSTETPHIQSLYTYLIGKKLDRIGFSLAVTAACQLLGLRDVHLVMSEDHSWIGFGGVDEQNCPKQTLEVTWHGKGVEDKRGQEIRVSPDDEDSWLYQKGHAVYCSRHMEVAAMVTLINSAINAHMNSIELVQIQQRLLWQLYENGHLKKYPNGLMNLAELEELKPTEGKQPCPVLYKEAVLSSRSYYQDAHIFPYTTYAAYAFRQSDYKTALKFWAHGARIIQQYRRSKNDEEIYREFFEISTDALVTVMKSCSTGFAANNVNRDPMCFAHLLRFFDGICLWEERSKSSVIHSTWAKAWIQAIGRFDYTIRRLVRLSQGTYQSSDSSSGKGGTNNSETGTMEEEFEKDSGIDEEDEPKPRVTLFSSKMWKINHFFKLEKFNPNEMTLNLLAPTTTESSFDKNEATKGGNALGIAGRTRRERSSRSTDSKMDVDEDEDNSSDSINKEGPATKRAKLSVS